MEANINPLFMHIDTPHTNTPFYEERNAWRARLSITESALRTEMTLIAAPIKANNIIVGLFMTKDLHISAISCC
jgi:uncharacterized UBP type Zn finger protein